MLLEGNVTKNVGKSLGARIAELLTRPGRTKYGNLYESRNLEKLFNLYSLIGPEYITNKYTYGDDSLYRALDNYAERRMLKPSLARDLILDFRNQGINFKPESKDNYLTDEDWYTNGFYNNYTDENKKVFNQLKFNPSFENASMGLSGRYNNTLPQWGWLQRLTHPLQVDLRYYK